MLTDPLDSMFAAPELKVIEPLLRKTVVPVVRETSLLDAALLVPRLMDPEARAPSKPFPVNTVRSPPSEKPCPALTARLSPELLGRLELSPSPAVNRIPRDSNAAAPVEIRMFPLSSRASDDSNENEPVEPSASAESIDADPETLEPDAPDVNVMSPPRFPADPAFNNTCPANVFD